MSSCLAENGKRHNNGRGEGDDAARIKNLSSSLSSATRQPQNVRRNRGPQKVRKGSAIDPTYSDWPRRLEHWGWIGRIRDLIAKTGSPQFSDTHSSQQPIPSTPYIPQEENVAQPPVEIAATVADSVQRAAPRRTTGPAGPACRGEKGALNDLGRQAGRRESRDTGRRRMRLLLCMLTIMLADSSTPPPILPPPYPTHQHRSTARCCATRKKRPGWSSSSRS